MIVIYLKEDNQYIMKIDGFPELIEQGNKLYMAGKVIINDLTKAGYAEYPDQEIVIPTEWDEELETNEELPVTLEELNLRDFTVTDLPSSNHLAIIKSIKKNNAKPVTVIRQFAGRNFDVPCVVTESVKDQFLSGDVVVGDIVIVTCCEERPDDTVVLAKVFKSW